MQLRQIIACGATTLMLLCANTAFATEPTIKISLGKYVGSGLPPGFPSTFIYAKDGNPIAFYDPRDHEAVTDIMEKGLPVVGNDKAAAASTRLVRLLADHGMTVESLLSPASQYTIVEINLAPSVGDCGPCNARQQMVDKAVSGKAIDATVRMIELSN